MKLSKWHTIVYRCPKCSAVSDYALQIVDGPLKGSPWNPAYCCEKCSAISHAREPWLFGVVYGPLMAMFGVFAIGALPASLNLPHWVALLFAGACCAVVGWPLSRYLSRHLLLWEPTGKSAVLNAGNAPE